MIHPRYYTSEAKEVERFVQSALDALSAHTAILDQQGQIVGVNKAWRRFGDENMLQDENHCLGMNYLDVCRRSAANDSASAAVAAEGIRDVINGIRDDFSLEYPCHGNGTKRWFVMNVTRFEWEGEIRVIVSHQNVTAIKSIQVELAESKKRTEVILDNVVNGVFTLDEAYRIESANPAACDIFGYTNTDAMLGVALTDLCENLHNLFDGNEGITEEEFVGIRQDGVQFPAIVSIRQVVVDHQVIRIAIVQDISERKQAEAEALAKERLRLELQKERELRELRNQFLAMLSHEFRTPLTSIMLSGDMLKYYSEHATDEKKQQYLQNIQTQVRQLTELIQDVMTVSKEETHNIHFQPKPIDTVNLIDAIVTEFQMNHWQSHEIVFTSEAEALELLLDSHLIRRVFNNLLSNAIKYSPENGKVHVRLSRENGMACISVSDNGIGIPLEDQENLFQPFYRASNAKRLELPGTGLGLMITRQAIELHEGRIELKSQEGKGTTVHVWIPVPNDQTID